MIKQSYITERETRILNGEKDSMHDLMWWMCDNKMKFASAREVYSREGACILAVAVTETDHVLIEAAGWQVI